VFFLGGGGNLGLVAFVIGLIADAPVIKRISTPVMASTVEVDVALRPQGCLSRSARFAYP
jgi:hypothetical protein